MRYAIISDIHSNLEAFEAVLAEIEREPVDQIVCVGDIVGYAACPQDCIDIIRKREIPCVAGNHDYASVDKTSIQYFNPDARDAILWTREALGQEAMDYLANLPLTLDFDGFTLAHGTLQSPELFDYIQTIYDAHL